MKKLFCIISCILIFAISTIVVLSSDNSGVKKVSFVNQNLIINHENTEVKNENVTLNLNKSEFQNTKTDLNTTNLNLQSSKINKRNININNKSFENQDSEYNLQDNSYSQRLNKLNNEKLNFENKKTRLKNLDIKPYTQDTSYENKRRYMYRDIDWNKWKSDFVNQITDDSVAITSLDDYGIGSWFYYSFTVTSSGDILDVTVRSMYLSKEDKQKIADLIRSYRFKDITIFPANSKRKTAKIDAVMVLGTTEKRAQPSDFNDREQVKIFLPD